jgi:hypothetical protein
MPGTVYRTATPEEAQAIASLAARSMLAADEELRIEGIQDETRHSIAFNPGRPLGPILKDAVAGRDLAAIRGRVEELEPGGLQKLGLPKVSPASPGGNGYAAGPDRLQ